ncbi:MAG: hypothetical protein Q8891_09735 [Bacteroidota bacterium]|nr:hypothetical protein [Bacteroidota bacterium]
MKKLMLAMAVVAFSAAHVNAQDSKSTTLSVAVNAGIPTSTGYSFVLGGDLQADFAVAAGTKITASAGYENYSWKGGGSSGFIPLLAGAKFNLGSDKLYGHAQLGYGFSTVSGGSGAFGYAPSIGYYFSSNLDASIKYLAFSRNGFTLGSVGIRLAYSF